MVRKMSREVLEETAEENMFLKSKHLQINLKRKGKMFRP